MKNVTITLDAQTASWVRLHAAEQDMSVSRFVGEVLRDRMRKSKEYDAAMKSYLGRGPFKELTGPAQSYPKRDELYDRPVLRRR